MDQESRFDIKVKSRATADLLGSYLVKAFLGLRDIENESRSVRLMGSGNAINQVILVTEIIRSRCKVRDEVSYSERKFGYRVREHRKKKR